MHEWPFSGSRSAALESGPNVGFGPFVFPIHKRQKAYFVAFAGVAA